MRLEGASSPGSSLARSAGTTSRSVPCPARSRSATSPLGSPASRVRARQARRPAPASRRRRWPRRRARPRPDSDEPPVLLWEHQGFIAVAIRAPKRQQGFRAVATAGGRRGRQLLTLPASRTPGHNAPVSLVGIDVGSSAVKAAAYRADGGLLGQAAEAVPSLHPVPGAAEVSADDVWGAVVRVVRRLADSPRVRRDPPAALAVSASGREGFPARANGTPLGPCL